MLRRVVALARQHAKGVHSAKLIMVGLGLTCRDMGNACKTTTHTSFALAVLLLVQLSCLLHVVGCVPYIALCMSVHGHQMDFERHACVPQPFALLLCPDLSSQCSSGISSIDSCNCGCYHGDTGCDISTMDGSSCLIQHQNALLNLLLCSCCNLYAVHLKSLSMKWQALQQAFLHFC